MSKPTSPTHTSSVNSMTKPMTSPSPAEDAMDQASPSPASLKHLDLPLELLTLIELDTIIIKEKVKPLEAVSTSDAANEFDLLLPGTKELLFVATEHSGRRGSIREKLARPYDMKVRLDTGETIFVAKRTFKCCMCLKCWSCSNCGRDQVLVYGSNEKDFYGSVKKTRNCLRPRYNVYNFMGMVQFTIVGSFSLCSLGWCWRCPRCCRQKTFMVYDAKTELLVGKMYKELSRGLVTDAGNIVLEFPEPIDVTMKAVLMSAVFLINTNHFIIKKLNK